MIAWSADGQDWADSLPALVAHACERWELTVGEPFEGGHTAWVAPAEGADGTRYVLKVPYPGRASRSTSPTALRLWDGDGAVRLLERDETTRALLLERIRPGTSLLDLADPEEALEIACGVLPRLWIAPPGGASVRDGAGLRRALGGRHRAHVRARTAQPFDAALLRGAVAAFEQLAALRRRRPSCLHQDFHRGNVLRGRARAVARDRSQAARRRARVRRPLAALRPAPLRAAPRSGRGRAARPAQRRARAGCRARPPVVVRARRRERLWCYESGEAADDDLALATALR